MGHEYGDYDISPVNILNLWALDIEGCHNDQLR
jgi:hypothetical protein